MPSRVADVTRAEHMRKIIVDVHKRIDELTGELQSIELPLREEVVRRAEEAGAALARLEWALHRAAER
jgi:hypothetical protein